MTIPMAAAEYEMFGDMHNDHFFSSTSISVLKGKKRMLVAGHFEFHEQKVEVFPYIIGEQVEGGGSLPTTFSSSIRTYPQQIDAFERVARSGGRGMNDPAERSQNGWVGLSAS
jgi:hypothetical protein